MAKTKISEFDSTPANNTDIDSINIAEGCAPSGINNAIRELMSQLKDQQTGASGDNFTVGGNLVVTGTSVHTGATTFTGAVVMSTALPVASGGTGATSNAAAAFAIKGANSDITSITGLTTALTVAQGGTGVTTSTGSGANVLGTSPSIASPTLTGTPIAPTASVGTNTTQLATTAFVRSIIPAGVIMLWSGSVASIPTGWVICDGTNSTPDLRDRFVVGAGSSYAVAGTGGSANAIVVSHSHTASVSDPGHNHTETSVQGTGTGISAGAGDSLQTVTSGTSTTGISVSISTVGDSATNANLPPYYSLAYIMKT